MTFLWNGALKELQPYSVPGLLVLRVTSEKNGNPLQYSCLENSMDRGVWWARVCRVTKSQTGLSTRTHTHTHTRCITFAVLNGHIIYGEMT